MIQFFRLKMYNQYTFEGKLKKKILRVPGKKFLDLVFLVI